MMTNKEITQIKNNIYHHLKEQRVYAALPQIKTLLECSASGELLDEFDKLNLEYKFLLQYFAQGIIDSERDNIFNKIVLKLYDLTDKGVNKCLTREDYSLYFSIKRTIQKNGKSLEKLLQLYSESLSNISLYSEVDKENQNDRNRDNLFKNKENTEADIFKYIWTSYPTKHSEIEIIKSIFECELYPDYFKSLIVSAILLSLIQFYNEDLLIQLLNNYSLPNHELSTKSLCAAILVLFLQKDRIENSVNIKQQIKTLSDNPQFTQDVKSILYLLIRSKNTEKLTRKVEDELIPKLMKIYPKVFNKFKSNNNVIDLSDVESNPQWKEMLENDGITKKIDELNKLQMEGSDVFIGTFSHLKSFPFFNEISNWFMPFHQEHTLLSSSLKKEEFKLIELILDSKFFCDSDKYSFVASMSSVPESQRNMMLAQFSEQSNALQEIKNSELPPSTSVNWETIANLYIQNIYRFFKLYPRKQEFTDLFNNAFDINDINCLTSNIELGEFIEIIGEFYLKNEYYNEAIKYFSLLQQTRDECTPVILQKIGFCHQNLENYEKAIDFYQKYELLADKDLWTERHLAACYRALKQPEIALKHYEEAERLSPENLSICLNIGHCLLELDRYDEALKYYYKVYYLEPNSPRVWRPIAWCLFVQGNYEQAHIYYNKIIQEKPSSNDYMNYGHLYFAEGDIKNAISMYKKSISKGGQTLSDFYANFISDEITLIKSGVSKNDISILINTLSLEMT